MEKMRVSQHSGRNGSARHNDRSFLKDMNSNQIKEQAPHIDLEKMKTNEMWTCYPDLDFKAGERAYYEYAFKKALEATNEKYIRARHPERCKTLDDWYNSDKTCPEEMILQIGNKDQQVTREEFRECFSDYLTWLCEWNMQHGNPFYILNYATHYDETSPHVHIRRVWQYEDKDGLLRVGQNKALKAAGVELPDPSKAESRYNNRKMSFDAEARIKWQEICKARGFAIETEPRPDMRHKEKAEYIANQLESERIEKENALNTVTKELANAQERLNEVSSERIKQSDILERTQNELSEASVSLSDRQMELSGTEFRLRTLNAQYEALNASKGHVEQAVNEAKQLATKYQTLADTAKNEFNDKNEEINSLEKQIGLAKAELDKIVSSTAEKQQGQQLLDMVDQVAKQIQYRVPYKIEVLEEHEARYNPITKKQTKPATVEVKKETFDTYLQDKNLIQVLTELLRELLELFRSITEKLRLEVVKETAYQEINGKLRDSEERNIMLQDRNMELSKNIDALEEDKDDLKEELQYVNKELEESREQFQRLKDRFPALSRYERICEYERRYENRNETGHDVFGEFYLPDLDGNEVRIWKFMKDYARECKDLGIKPREDIDSHYLKFHDEHLLESLEHHGQYQYRGHSL